MSTITYQQIEPLIVSATLDRNQMVCTFKTPSGKIIESKASVRRHNDVQSQVQNRIKQMGTMQARMAVSRTLNQVLGGGILGRTASMVVRSATTVDALGIKYTESEKQDAVVEAFKKVEQFFEFDNNSNAWRENKQQTISKGDPNVSEFEKQLVHAPIKNRYDKEVLARLLVEVANADGTISAEEKAFMQDFLPSEFGSIDALLRKDPLSPVECSEVDYEVRKTIYMLAWINALVDYDLDREEKSMLLEFAQLFGFNDADTRETIRIAKYYLVENALAEDLTRNELFDLADRLELSHEEAERCQIRYKKRQS